MLQGVPKPFGHRFMAQGKKSELKKISETSNAKYIHILVGVITKLNIDKLSYISFSVVSSLQKKFTMFF